MTARGVYIATIKVNGKKEGVLGRTQGTRILVLVKVSFWFQFYVSTICAYLLRMQEEKITQEKFKRGPRRNIAINLDGSVQIKAQMICFTRRQYGI